MKTLIEKSDRNLIKYNLFNEMEIKNMYYLHEYFTAFNLFPGTPSNNIYTFKSRDPYMQAEKEKVILAYANMLSIILGRNDITLIPMPTSKPNNIYFYNSYHYYCDDRLVKLCNYTVDFNIEHSRCQQYNTLDIFNVHNDIGSSSCGHSISREDLDDNIYIDQKKLEQYYSFKLAPNIVLIDDVITSGTHFRVCKNKLEEFLTQSNFDINSFNIYGVFLGKTTHLKNNIINFNNY